MQRIGSSIEKIGARLGVDVARAVEATPPVMKEEDLRALVEAGFSIGAHTVAHPYLTAESADRQREEIAESRGTARSGHRPPGSRLLLSRWWPRRDDAPARRSGGVSFGNHERVGNRRRPR